MVDRIAQLKTELRDTITTSNSEAATVFEARALEQRLAELESRARTSSGELAELSDLETHELASAVELAAAGLKKVFSENTE
ncbi:MAG: hypothetical protein NW217_10240 [Hyphomicrobiaceae bacterium]|nr:hypothetical protein [Hyphomicrobiaceae bacterium]